MTLEQALGVTLRIWEASATVILMQDGLTTARMATGMALIPTRLVIALTQLMLFITLTALIQAAVAISVYLADI